MIHEVGLSSYIWCLIMKSQLISNASMRSTVDKCTLYENLSSNGWLSLFVWSYIFTYTTICLYFLMLR